MAAQRLGGQQHQGRPTYYFTGWALDNSGNWSAGTPASITVPKNSKDVPNIVTKEARIQPNSSGSWKTAGFQGGDLIQQWSPGAMGLWFYGNQITDSMGSSGKVSVRSAQIYIRREDDSGLGYCQRLPVLDTTIRPSVGCRLPVGASGRTRSPSSDPGQGSGEVVRPAGIFNPNMNST